MPHPALGAIVIAAMLHLSKPGYLRNLFGRSRWEIALAAVVISGELTLGVLQGIALGVALSLLMLIYRTSHRRRGAWPATRRGGLSRRRGAPRGDHLPGLLIWRAGGDIFFASGHLHEGLKAALTSSHPPANHVLVDSNSVNFIDTSACDAVPTTIKGCKIKESPSRSPGWATDTRADADRGSRQPRARPTSTTV